MRRSSILVLASAAIAAVLLGLATAGCGESVDGQISIELATGCRPTLTDLQAEVDLYCISLERPDGTALVDPNCSNSLTGARLKVDEPTAQVVIVVEGFQRLVDGRHQVIARGKSPPVQLVSGERTSVRVPVSWVGAFGLLAADGPGCQPLPFALEGHTATAYPSGHVVVVGSARPDLGQAVDAVGLLIDSTDFKAEQLPTPASLYRHDHVAAALDDGRLVLIGGVTTAGGRATDELVVLRHTELLMEAYKPGLDYASGLYFEPLLRPLVHARARPAAAVFFGDQVLITDGEAPAEMFLGDPNDETSGELSVDNGQPFPQNGLTVTPVAYSVGNAVLVGTPNRIGRLAVGNGNRSAIFHGFQADVSGRDRPIGLLLPDGSVMVVGYRAAAGGLDSPLIVVSDIAGTPQVVSIPVPAGFPERGHTATLLADGRALVVGGVDAQGRPAGSFFVVPGGADGWEVIDGPALNLPRQGHTASLLPDGRVLVVGGGPVDADPASDPALSAEVIAF